ncbi:MAG: tetratricopeptide repeat protein, partial [Planctomycetes bacterium]|nr:tetratricopeptide repeat protein [Planctomycetota bacterium]
MSDLVTTFQAAASAFRERNWIEAEALCRQILTADSRHADALHMLALVCSETDRPDDAVTYLREAIAQQPENPALWVNLGIIYRETEQFAQTIECELQAIRLRDELPEAYYNLSLAYHGLGQFENA